MGFPCHMALWLHDLRTHLINITPVNGSPGTSILFLPYFDKCCLIVDVCLCSRPDVELSSTMKVSEK